jgi:8-oxo-dGTP pyrophosphatase MutT (NUDIX family)
VILLATGSTSWINGTMPLRVSAFSTDTFTELPRSLVSSVRCLVWVGSSVVLCTNKDGSHPLPGGRREPGETYVDTAAREVHEETGWLLDRDSLRPVGWLRLEHLSPQRPGDPHPYPVFLQLVYTGTASDRDGGVDVAWTDTEGYEVESRLVTLSEARAATNNDLLAHSFLDLVR